MIYLNNIYSFSFIFVFIVVKSHNIKHSVLTIFNCTVLWCWGRLRKVPWTAGRSNRSVLSGGDQPSVVTGRMDAEAEAPVYWSFDANRQLIGKVPNAGENGGQKEKRMSEDKMAGRHHRSNEHELEQIPGDGEGQGGLMCCSPWGHKELDTTG